MFKKIYAHLKNNNIDCYSIGQHEGKCIKPYVVIKDMGKAKTNNSVVYKKMVELYVYYPLGNYSMVEGFVNEIEEIMTSLSFKESYEATPTIIDDDKKAYLTRLSYYDGRRRSV